MKKIYPYILFSFLSLISNASETEQSYQDDAKHYCSAHSLFGQGDFSTHVSDPGLLKYDVRYYRISLEVNDTSTFIKGYSDVMASAIEDMDELVLELNNALMVDSILLNGMKTDSFTHTTDLIRISPETSLAKDGFFTAKVYYHGGGGVKSFYAGISNRLDSQWNTRVTYTLSEPFRARDWFACKQVLTDKADSADIYITVDEGLMAGSNGILLSIDSLSDKRLRYHWHSGYPIAYYLLSLSVSDYQDYSFYTSSTHFGDSLLVQNFVYDVPGYLELNKENIDLTADMLDLYSGLMSPYPFMNEKYGHCLAPMGGGMEHQTMTTLSGFGFTLVAHELAHQWFGDNVTCASWQDIWVNEGFASYGEYIALEKLKSGADARIWMDQAHDWARSEPEGSVYIPEQDATNVSRIFSRALTYKKGASILHMIRYELDDDTVFFNTLANFQKAYSDSVATGEDFLSVLNETSGDNFDWFFQQWYHGKGFPYFNVLWWQNNDSLYIEIHQEGSSSETPFFRTHLDFLLRYEDGTDTLIRTVVNQAFTRILLAPGLSVTNIEIDPMNWVLDRSEIIRKYPQNSYLSVNPNPFGDKLNIVFLAGNGNREIVLTDLNGKVLKKHTSSSGTLTLDTHNLSQGLYLLQVKDGKDSYSAKVIRQ